MGAKFEICYLSDKNNRDILVNTLCALFDVGIKYNEYIHGEYSYWIDCPIWKFGESATVIEQKRKAFKEIGEIDSIINVLSSHFSPTITLGAYWFGKAITLILSTCESEEKWNEVKISVDRYEVFDSLKSIEKEKAIVNLREIFNRTALNLKPYYGIAATEMMGLASSAENLQIDNHYLGDFNYFDRSLVLKMQLSDYTNDYVIEELIDGCAFLYKLQGILDLG